MFSNHIYVKQSKTLVYSKVSSEHINVKCCIGLIYNEISIPVGVEAPCRVSLEVALEEVLQYKGQHLHLLHYL